ncbi:MAG: YhcH/YjgK/YiaL family protein, partial [Bacteroidales bacterium]|nr:YhcH/YjgK/YiaL family protein [Bacteroidales bacterium]
MVVDILSSAELYDSVNPHFKTAFDFLKKTDLKTLPVGKHVIDGENVFAVVSEYETKLPQDTKFET